MRDGHDKGDTNSSLSKTNSKSRSAMGFSQRDESEKKSTLIEGEEAFQTNQSELMPEKVNNFKVEEQSQLTVCSSIISSEMMV